MSTSLMALIKNNKFMLYYDDMIVRILFTLCGTFLFLFLFWRKLREDYILNHLFTVGFYSLFGLSVFSIISFYLEPKWLFWLSLIGSVIGLVFGISKFHFRIFETLEAWVLGNLGVLIIFYLYEFSKNPKIENVALVLVNCLLIFLFLFLDKHYKKFTWYKSGRVGFAGLTIVGTFFLIRCLVAIVLPNMLFFVGRIDAIMSGSVAFISFLGLLTLSRSET